MDTICGQDYSPDSETIFLAQNSVSSEPKYFCVTFRSCLSMLMSRVINLEPGSENQKEKSFFLKINLFYLFIFIFGCVGSLLLHVGFL